jgi:hypothetical protein
MKRGQDDDVLGEALALIQREWEGRPRGSYMPRDLVQARDAAQRYTVKIDHKGYITGIGLAFPFCHAGPALDALDAAWGHPRRLVVTTKIYANWVSSREEILLQDQRRSFNQEKQA